MENSRFPERLRRQGNVRRAIDLHEGEEVDEAALKELIREAAALNLSAKNKSSSGK
jgi:hypothetical protein